VGCGGDTPESLVASAKVNLGKSDNKAAIIELKNALQKNPSLAEARFLLGSSLLADGDFVGGELELGKAAELGYSRDQVIPLQARSLLAQRKYEKLISTYGKAEAVDLAALADLESSLAAAYMATGKPAEAKAALDVAVVAKPGYLEAQLLYARLKGLQGNLQEALHLVDQVIKSHPNHAPAWVLKGDLLNVLKDGTAAIAAYREALKHDKRNMAAHDALIESLLTGKDVAGAKAQLADLRKQAPNRLQTSFLAAMTALEGGELKQAREQMQQVLKAAPNDVKVLYIASGIEFRLGSLLQAERYATKALAAMPDHPDVRFLLSKIYLRSGDISKGVTTLQPLLNVKNPAPQVLSLAGEAALMQGDAAKAEAYFSRVAKLDPKDARSRTVLALGQLDKGNSAQGMEQLRSISAGDAGVTADLALISAYVKKGEFDAALKAIDAMELKQPGQAMAAHLRGNIELTRNKSQAARDAFEAALKITPGFTPSLTALTNLDLQEKQPERAKARFEKALAVDPKNIKLQMGLWILKAETGASKDELAAMLQASIKDDPTAAAPRIALMRLEMDRKQFKQAQAYAREALVAFPDDVEMLNLVGSVQAASDDLNQATTTYTKLVALQPASPLPSLRLAEVYEQQKDLLAAVHSLKRALSIKPDFLQAQRALILLELRRGRAPEAREVVKLVQKQRPDEPAGFLMEGDLEQVQKNFGAASLAYRKALLKSRGAVLPEVAMKLHSVLIADEKSDEAATFETKWLQQHPDDAAFIAYLGDRAIEKSNWEQAQQHFRAALKLQPSNLVVMNNLAWLLNRSDSKEAMMLAEKVNQLQPNKAPFMDTLAEIHAGQRNWVKAVEIQKRVIEIAPDQANYRLRLAKYYIGAGQSGPARKELQRLTDLGSKFSAHDEVKALLSTL